MDEMSIDGNKLVVDCGEDIDICCEAFGLLDTETVRGVILYAVTVGDVLSEEGSALQRVFEDMWGTALTDSARILLRERFLEDTNLSDSFGPGYYGMRPEEMRKIGGLLDIGELGIEIRETGMMVPDKSCAGIYFDVTDSYLPLPEACVYCAGNDGGCRLCMHRAVETDGAAEV